MLALELLKEDRDYCLSINNDKSIIAQYDEAIKELEELQNRKCSNCKYATLDSARYLSIHKCLMGCNKVNYDFSCSEWKQK